MLNSLQVELAQQPCTNYRVLHLYTDFGKTIGRLL